LTSKTVADPGSLFATIMPGKKPLMELEAELF
jgi:hypothetical protein